MPVTAIWLCSARAARSLELESDDAANLGLKPNQGESTYAIIACPTTCLLSHLEHAVHNTGTVRLHFSKADIDLIRPFEPVGSTIWRSSTRAWLRRPGNFTGAIEANNELTTNHLKLAKAMDKCRSDCWHVYSAITASRPSRLRLIQFNKYNCSNRLWLSDQFEKFARCFSSYTATEYYHHHSSNAAVKNYHYET